jgi:Uma2 family endonuclease
MAAAPTLPAVTVEEYLRSSYRPDCEYVDGVLEPKALPSPPHSLLHRLLIQLLFAHEESHDYMALTELRIQTGPRRFRVPDIALMPGGWKHDRTLIPLECIEVLSPDDRIARVVSRVRDLHTLGVRSLVVADPQTRSLFVAGSNGLLEEIPPGVVTLDLPGRSALALDFGEIFAQVPQK